MSINLLAATTFAITSAIMSPSTDHFTWADGLTGVMPAAASAALPHNQTASVPGVEITLPPTPMPAMARPTQPKLGVFRSVAISAARLPAARKWHSAKSSDYTALFGDDCTRSGLRACDTAFARKLRGVAARAADLSERDLLGLVNRTVNGAMRYQDDRAIWGASDYWATPVEMALKNAGDCEDFATAKYWLLRSLGMSDDQLQIVVLQDTRRRLFHAVLVVHTASGAYVLDNVSNAVQRDSANAQYHPIMSFAGDRSYIHGFAAGTTNIADIPKDLSAVAPGSGL